MKLIIILIFLNYASTVYCQEICDFYCHNFEDSNVCTNNLFIDSIHFQNNVWQIGQPQKPNMGVAYTLPNVIITDRINPYPINSNSVFIIRKLATVEDVFGFRTISGVYNVQSDSINDFGKMEFSGNRGTTWIDLINDSAFNIITWFTPRPVLTGRSNGWIYFDGFVADVRSIFNFNVGDTLMYKFTFKSDNISENLGGLMFDEICFSGFVEGISEIRFGRFSSKIFPNPSSENNFTIEYENPDADFYELAVYDMQSHPMLKKENIRENKITIDLKSYKAGMYVYKLTNMKAKKRSWGKFIIAE